MDYELSFVPIQHHLPHALPHTQRTSLPPTTVITTAAMPAFPM